MFGVMRISKIVRLKHNIKYIKTPYIQHILVRPPRNI